MEAEKLSETPATCCSLKPCKHCGKPAAKGQDYCCNGCEAAGKVLQQGGKFSAFAQDAENGEHQLTLAVDGIHCASCIQLIENALQEEEAVTSARVNMSTKRLQFSWNGDAVLGDALAEKVEKLGYKLTAFDVSQSAQDEQDEQKFLLRCIAVAGFAMGNIMLLSVTLWSSNLELMGMATRDLMHWVSALIALPAIIYAGQPFYASAWRVLKQGHTNMDVPISLAVLLASGMSLWETFRHGEHAYFDSATMLLFFLLIGRYLDARARGKARESAQGLLAMLQGTATVIEGNKQRVIPIKELRAGMQCRVAVGEKIPADSVVISGESELDTSLITGETVPRAITAGDRIFAGTLNLSAPLVVEVAKASEDSLLSDIVKLMEQAEQGQAKYVRLADKAARLYTPVVHTLGLLSFLGWWLGMGIDWQDALMIAVTVLIITCPCALGLAVPVVQVLASGKLMQRGILLKSGDALEKLSSIDHIVFDKTGTLTLGRPELQSPHDNLQLAASLAAHSHHPYSKAISAAYEGELLTLEGVEEVAGKGVQGFYQGKNLRLGKAEWCDAPQQADSSQPQIWLAQEGDAPVAYRFTDPLREDATANTQQLATEGLVLELLSGDREATVKQVAGQLSIDHWQAGLTPVEKTKVIKQHLADGHQLLMVGDGLNDAPSLAAASVSISPASAMDITQNTADIVFQGDRLSPVLSAWHTAKRATRLVKQNFALAVIYNLIAIPLAVLGYVTPLIAAIAMSGSSLLVIGNSFRLYEREK